MEYIGRQDVIDTIRREAKDNSGLISYVDTDEIEALDTIDIVRCGECRKRGTNGCPLLMISSHNIDVPEDDDFCSWGEL